MEKIISPIDSQSGSMPEATPMPVGPTVSASSIHPQIAQALQEMRVESAPAQPVVVYSPEFSIPSQSAVPIPNPTALAPISQQTSQGSAMPVGVSASSRGHTFNQRPAMPKGIYVIAGFAFLGVIGDFLNTTDNTLSSIAMVIDLLLVLGLLTRVEMVRKITLFFQVFLAGSMIIAIIGLTIVVNKVHQLEGDYHAAIARLDQSRMTSRQKQALAVADRQIEDEKAKMGKAVSLAYVNLGLSLVVCAGTAYYLTRPHVKEAFHN